MPQVPYISSWIGDGGVQAGAAQAAVPTTAATNATPYGYSQAQANAIVALLNEIRSVLVNSGLMKGSA